MYEAAEDLDMNPDDATLNRIAREARRHGCRARIVEGATGAPHVLVLGGGGETLATRSAVRLARWLGY
jgi:hypothetical protein